MAELEPPSVSRFAPPVIGIILWICAAVWRGFLVDDSARSDTLLTGYLRRRRRQPTSNRKPLPFGFTFFPDLPSPCSLRGEDL